MRESGARELVLEISIQRTVETLLPWRARCSVKEPFWSSEAIEGSEASRRNLSGVLLHCLGVMVGAVACELEVPEAEFSLEDQGPDWSSFLSEALTRSRGTAGFLAVEEVVQQYCSAPYRCKRKPALATGGASANKVERGARPSRKVLPAGVRISPGLPTAASPKQKAETAEPEDLEERAEVEIENGATYTGQWRGKERTGRGVLRKASGHSYEGEFCEGKLHGRGSFEGADGSRYEGEWLRGKVHGYGSFVNADGSAYTGEWDQDGKAGLGVETWADGSRYEGEFLDGKKDGVGSFQGGDGSRYDGHFRHDAMHGKGCLKFADGRAYCGQWHQGKMWGEGTMEWPDGSFYEGHFERDVKSGEGTFTWPDGTLFRGQWQSDRQHGKGVAVHIDGREHSGRWVHGELQQSTSAWAEKSASAQTQDPPLMSKSRSASSLSSLASSRSSLH